MLKEILKNKWRIAYAVNQTALVAVFIGLSNATNSKDLWQVRKLQTVNIALLWLGSWLHKKGYAERQTTNEEPQTNKPGYGI